ncbi:cytochrome oxidase complex assembly protein 1 [Flavobacterium sp. 270]|uniref:cytochrome c oxidase assembly factor Coa1 family protein n=1 Tax=Flavobacterium sp. 270 TaxID=2512114 RepID=UPI001065B338|nr:cytochrome c oxidase assembly factor Coa1 family protein [Flavobacterium sp. 270]TDW52508.1 cytochrome oxidase complex assembly protein 1 [Flavobacterium sp. 270]
MLDDYYEPANSWWDKNWKWFVPTGCVTIIMLLVLFAAEILLGVASILTESDAYKEAMDKVQHNELVVKQLGNPIEKDGMISGNIDADDDSGNCDLEIPIKGPKGAGVLFVTAHKNGKWIFDELSVYVNKTNTEINLLKK